MDNVAVSRRNHIDKKGNKENAQPAHGSKSFIKRDKTSLAPFHLKSNEKEETLVKDGPLKAKTKQLDTRPTSGEALKKVKTLPKDGKGAAAVSDVKQRQTYSRAFHAEQAVKHKKIVAEAPKPPAAVQSSKSAPGMYKGKIIQSKIGSIWKSSASVDGVDSKPSAPKTESQRVGNAMKIRSKSVADLPRHGTQKPAPTMSKSLVSRPAQVSKPAVTSRAPAGFYSARPPTRTVPATLTRTSSRNTSVAPTKGSGTQNSKPKIPVTDKRVNKPSVSSTLSQYRFSMETAEERRAKLAAWQASKGKTFKRPAMTTTLPPKTKVSKPKADLESRSHVEPLPAAQCESEPSLEAHKPDSTAANCADTQGAELATYNQTPVIINTTLELLENSDVDPQDGVDDVVVNLCNALEAMETPSRCSDELSQVSDECNVEMVDSNQRTECTKEAVNEILQDVCEQAKVEQVKNEAEKSDEDKVDTDDAEEVESDDDDDEDVIETTPPVEDASVVKYSVKTTPYLQSVKKTIEGEASTSRRKSNIKDLKFLTPVRRSCRIQRKSSHLPTMLVDHDPCVSSLAELVKMDDDPNAYIYRKNPALLEDLPDTPRL